MRTAAPATGRPLNESVTVPCTTGLTAADGDAVTPAAPIVASSTPANSNATLFTIVHPRLPRQSLASSGTIGRTITILSGHDDVPSGAPQVSGWRWSVVW